LNEQKQEDRWIVHLLHYVPERRGQAFDIIEDIIPVDGVAVSVRVPREVRRVTLVPQGKELGFTRDGGRVHFVVPRLEGHQMVMLQF
jgi:hypothetical protein